MSHCHPEGTPTRRASAYGLPIDPVKGESLVSVGQPQLIHQNDLKENNPPMAMSRRDYMALKTEISLYTIFLSKGKTRINEIFLVQNYKIS